MPSSITLTVSHLPTSTSFFLSSLQPLNYVFRGRQDQTIGFGPASPASAPPDFWITQEIPGVPAGAAHVAFPASSRAQVEQFFVAALKAGGKIHGEPSQRDDSGYFSAAVIDFDGNSIEAVYRPALEQGSQVGGSGTVVSQAKGKAPSTTSRSGVGAKAPSTIAAPKSMVSVAKAPTTIISHAKTRAPSTVVSQARSRASQAPPPALSQIRSVTAPSYVGGLPTLIETPAPLPEQAAQPSTSNINGPGSGDILNTLINDARTAASVARDLINSVKPNLNTTDTIGNDNANANIAPAAGQSNSVGTPSGNNGTGAGEAIVGTLLGVAAGAALHYAFSSHNRSKEKLETERLQLEGGYAGSRPSVVGRNITDPTPLPLRTEYAYGHEYALQSTVGPGPGPGSAGVYPHYRAIEAGPPMSAYGAGAGQSDYDNRSTGPRQITMHDNDHYSTHSSSTIRQAASHIKSSLSAVSKASGSQVSRHSNSNSKASNGSRTGSVKMNAPPTSYRAPSVLTAAETQMVASVAKSSRSTSVGAQSRHSSRSRSLSRVMGDAAEKISNVSKGSKASKGARSRSQSHSRVNGNSHTHTHSQAPSTASRRSRRDKFDDGAGDGDGDGRNGDNHDDGKGDGDDDDGEEARTVVHLTDKVMRHFTGSHTSKTQSKTHDSVASHHSKKPSSRASSRSRRTEGREPQPQPHEYPLPPSRAATWAGSDLGGKGAGSGVGMGVGVGRSLVSSSGRVVPGKHISAPRTIIGKLNPLRTHGLVSAGAGVGVGAGAGDCASGSVVSKQKDLADLDVTDREVGPEDSVSQVSVESWKSKRSSRAGSRR